ncbi:MAG: glycosyltransferase [Christensenellales bacterium]|jgi:glycosyltransferase involved in cell wall biosynthesis
MSKDRNEFITKLLLIGLAVAMPLGEGINRYVPHFSLAYVVLGALLLLFLVLSRLHAKKQSDLPTQAKSHMPLGIMLYLVLILIVAAFSILRLISDRSIGIGATIKTPLFMLISGAMVFVLSKKHEHLFAFFAFFCLVFLLSVFVFGNQLENNGLIRYMGTFADPNTMARDAMFAVMASLLLIVSGRLRLLGFVSLTLSLLAVYLSGSRGPLLGLLVAMTYLALPTFNKKHLRFLVAGVFLMLLLLALNYEIFADSKLYTWLERVFVGNSQASSLVDNLRFRIWGDYLSQAGRFLWTGMDPRHYTEISTHVTHNSILDFFVTYGLLPAMLYLSILGVIVFKKPSKLVVSKVRIYRWLKAIALGFIVSDLFVDSANMRSGWFGLALGLMAVYAPLTTTKADKRTRLLIIRRDTGNFGGIEHQISYLITELKKLSIDVFFVSNRDGSKLFDHSKEHAFCADKLPLGLNIKNVLGLRRYCRRHQIDIIQSHMFKESFLARLVRLWNPDLKHVFRVHTYIDCSHISSWKKNLYHFVSWLSDGLVDAYVSINNFNIIELRNRTRISRKKIHHVHNAVPALGAPDDLKSRPWPNNKLAMIANFVVGKGHNVLLEGLSILKEKGLHFEAHLIGGQSDLGGTLDAVQKQADELGLTQDLVFTGFVSDVKAELDQVSIVVLPSDSEGTPNCLLEAMSLKKLVVASDVGGVGEFIHDGISGILHTPRSPQGFAHALLKAHELSGEEMRKICEQGYNSWTDFSLNRTSTGLVQVYESLLATKVRT